MSSANGNGIVASNSREFDWSKPHPHSIILLAGIGDEAEAFSIHRDLLFMKAPWFEKFFADRETKKAEQAQKADGEPVPRGDKQNTEEDATVAHLEDVDPELLGLAQRHMYTGSIKPNNTKQMLGYEKLVDAYKLAHRLGMEEMCNEVVEVMKESYESSHLVPGPSLLVKVWKDTPEGSIIRRLLLKWAVAYIRSSETRAEYTKSLPQEVLSELVVAMSHLEAAPISEPTPSSQIRRKTVHGLAHDSADESDQPKSKAAKIRHSDAHNPRPFSGEVRLPVSKKVQSRASLPSQKPKPMKVKRPRVHAGSNGREWTAKQKLVFCDDLLSRMMSGPSFWTRLVGKFKYPVKPVEDGVPDYFEHIKEPMALSTMREKMDSRAYTTAEQFLADFDLIIDNCHQYHPTGSELRDMADKLKKYFGGKYAEMDKWLAESYDEWSAKNPDHWLAEEAGPADRTENAENAGMDNH
ncbi:TFIID associated protein [Xylariaceae sp. FL0016]|nr:TFIID associated protein [Xylariaceae sp. FL0016]